MWFVNTFEFLSVSLEKSSKLFQKIIIISDTVETDSLHRLCESIFDFRFGNTRKVQIQL